MVLGPYLEIAYLQCSPEELPETKSNVTLAPAVWQHQLEKSNSPPWASVSSSVELVPSQLYCHWLHCVLGQQ
jgi:hypothetical protein